MKQGDEITIMYEGAPRRAHVARPPLVNGAPWIGGPPDESSFAYAIPNLDGAFGRGPLFIEDQGITWLPGWGEEIEAELRAADALRPDEWNPLPSATGRWPSRAPNVQNYPKRADGRR